jgi:hypothetical protein
MRQGADISHVLSVHLPITHAGRPDFGLRFSNPLKSVSTVVCVLENFLGRVALRLRVNLAVLYSEPAHFRSHRLIDMGIGFRLNMYCNIRNL